MKSSSASRGCSSINMPGPAGISKADCAGFTAGQGCRIITRPGLKSWYCSILGTVQYVIHKVVLGSRAGLEPPDPALVGWRGWRPAISWTRRCRSAASRRHRLTHPGSAVKTLSCARASLSFVLASAPKQPCPPRAARQPSSHLWARWAGQTCMLDPAICLPSASSSYLTTTYTLPHLMPRACCLLLLLLLIVQY